MAEVYVTLSEAAELEGVQYQTMARRTQRNKKNFVTKTEKSETANILLIEFLKRSPCLFKSFPVTLLLSLLHLQVLLKSFLCNLRSYLKKLLTICFTDTLLMQITGANDVDIMLDEDGQPVSDGNGDTALVSDDECWLQDIKNEAMTEEGELFYEDEEGDASYGWSLLDFMQGEYDDFTQMEIQQRIRSKMSKRDYIDAGSIQTTVNFDGHIYHIRIAFRRTDSNSEYNIDIESNGVEVIVE